MNERSISLHELPVVPGRSGWPWNEQGARPHDAREADAPTITIVMPSFNQGKFLEEAIRSVLLQNYPRVELRVMDGGSTDASRMILERYAPFLAYWVSERDRGQSNAINKGLAQAQGVLFNWLNSDDLLLPGALWALARAWQAGPVELLTGRCKSIDEVTGRCLRHWKPRAPSDPSDFFSSHGVVLAQPSTFVSTERLRQMDGVREDLHYVMDWDMYLRLSLMRPALRCRTVDDTLSISRNHPDTKTSQRPAAFRQEAIEALQRIRQPLGIRGRARLIRWKRFLELQERLTAILDRGDYRALFRTPLRYPESIFSRPFWGAVLRMAGVRKS